MYNPELVAERIKEMTSYRNTSISKMLSDCDIAKNTVTRLKIGSDITLCNVFKIANYLNVSVDYLLGRTNVKEVNK